MAPDMAENVNLSSFLGMQFAPIKIPIRRRLQTFAVFFWMSTFLFGGLATSSLLYILYYYTRFWYISLGYIAWMLYDLKTCNTGGRNGWVVELVRNWGMWKHYSDFFPVKLIKTVDLDPDQNYLLGSHPHGVLCSGAFCSFATNGAGWNKKFPGLTARLLTLEGQFWLPGTRELTLSGGCCAATKAGLESTLGRSSGTATVLVVGGAPESLNNDPKEIKLVLKKRKGFVKLALRYGVDLVPTFSFGEHKVYGQIPNPEGSWVRWLQDALQHVVGFAPVLFTGRGVFQYNMGIVPYRTPINVVVGAPISVSKVISPSRDQIEELHTKYVEELVKLYDTYNQEYGYPEMKLVIS